MKLTSMSVDTNQPSSQIMNDKNLEDNDIAHAPKILAVVWQNCKDCMSNGMESLVQRSEKQVGATDIIDLGKESSPNLF
ncbi:hypothetical protein Tco_0471021 [Tanacetum coccineum]